MRVRTAPPLLATALAATLAALPGPGAAAGGDGKAGALEPLVLSAAPGGAKQPSVAVDAKGGVHVAFVAGGRIVVASRPAGEASFADHAVADASGAACGMRRGPRIAACAGALVVSWIESRFDPGKKAVVGSRNLVAGRSTDGGRTWSPPSPVNRHPAACGEGLHALAAGPGKALYAAWLQPAEEGKRGTVIRLARSEDAGATWSGECTVYASPSGTVCECCHPSVAAGPDGAVAVMFRNSLEGARDMFVALSPDQGRTFAPARRLGRGTWPLKACPMDGGGLAFGPGGVLFTAWRREATVFLMGAGDAEEEAGPGAQPWVGGVPGGAAFAAWTDPGGDLLAASLGTPAREVRRVPAAGDRCVYPVVAGSASGVVFAAWERVPKDPARTRVEGAFLQSAQPGK
jgi:hypothetical protein